MLEDFMMTSKKTAGLFVPVFGTGALVTAAIHADAAQQTSKPNILLIMADDHSRKAISCYGSKINKTPNIDRIAAMGVQFDNAFCNNAICGPCRAAVISGKHSSANGFISNLMKKPFDFSQSTLFRSLKTHGYTTALIGKWHLGKGFYGTENIKDAPLDYWALWKGYYYNCSFETPEGIKKTKGYSTDVITDMVIDWMGKQIENSKPFFMMCTYNAVHRTWTPSLKYMTKYKDVDIPEPETLYDNWEGRSPTLKQNNMSIAKHFYYSYDLKVHQPVPFASEREKRLKDPEYRRLSPEQKKIWDAAYKAENDAYIKEHPTGKAQTHWKYERYIKNYLRCICSIDDGVGKMLDFMKEKGLLDNTIVIYTSDQGFFLGEHGWYDKRWMFEEALRIPVLMYIPKVSTPGEKVETMVQNIDIAPTLIDAAGIPVPKDMQGVSLISLIEGKVKKVHDSIYYHYFEYGGEHNVAAHEGVRTDRYKLINFYRDDGFNLFDLKNDPHELKDVSENPEYAGVLKIMTEELAKLRKQYKEPTLKK